MSIATGELWLTWHRFWSFLETALITTKKKKIGGTKRASGVGSGSKSGDGFQDSANDVFIGTYEPSSLTFCPLKNSRHFFSPHITQDSN